MSFDYENKEETKQKSNLPIRQKDSYANPNFRHSNTLKNTTNTNTLID